MQYYVSVWYGKLHFLGLKRTVFCHFETFDHQKKLLKPVVFAKEASADTQRPIKSSFKIFVHYFSMGVRITVQLTIVIPVQRCNVPHFKGLIYAKVDLEAQGSDSTFTFCHT